MAAARSVFPLIYIRWRPPNSRMYCMPIKRLYGPVNSKHFGDKYVKQLTEWCEANLLVEDWRIERTVPTGNEADYFEIEIHGTGQNVLFKFEFSEWLYK